MENIFKKFTPNLKKILVEAEKIASEKKTVLDTEHELLSLLQTKNTLAFEILNSFDLRLDKVELIISLLGKKESSENPSVSDGAKKSIQLAVQTASKFNHSKVDSEHLLLALVSNKNFKSYMVIERSGINPEKIKKQIESIFSGINKSFQSQAKEEFNPENFLPEDMFENSNMMGGAMPFMQAPTNQKKESVLDQFSSNLTKKAEKNDLDPVIGREVEINRIIQTLCRRSKNNPILIGEPGVGKTSIVEGLAQRIGSGNVPQKIANTEIRSVDLGSILAGTMYRGQFESRIKKILEEIKKKGNIILFVDEIHMLIGAGSTEGSIDAANLLKPMLARGELRMIGSTTLNEYKKYIEKDPAFERRFQPLMVKEPDVLETVKILNGIKNRYENFHNVRYEELAVEAAATFSKRYINDRFLPDKAIDLIDEAGAEKNAKIIKPTRLDILGKELAKVLVKKEAAISAEEYEKAASYREQEVKIQQEIDILSHDKSTNSEKVVTVDDIAKLISDWTGIPVKTMSAQEKKNYFELDKRLKRFIIGQDDAVMEVAKSLKRSRVGINNPDRPIGSFMFLGPTGVGKTELAKVLAKEIFGDQKSLVKIDMSEFMERHNLSRLVGSPAGYVGYEEGGKLTEFIRKNPYSVILFDEIEKAHPEVFNILLQIMDEGNLTDAKGRTIDFRNTIVIMTSNLGTDILKQQSAIGFNNSSSFNAKIERLKSNILDVTEKSFRPEFLNRLDKIVVFYPLNEKSIAKIAQLQIDELINRLSAQGYNIKINKSVIKTVAEKSYNAEFGARPIKKYIADHIELLITDAILSEKIIKNDMLILSSQDDKIDFEIKNKSYETVPKTRKAIKRV